tara:strand:- start:798 stop:1559 length:762 start_codon:yes stop_codon:yes gene_type:complete
MFNVNEIMTDLIEKDLIGIKVSFEDEGADFVDVSFLKTFCDKNNIQLNLKVSGAEAIRDMKDANKLYITKLVAPMIESSFALEKFIKSSRIYYKVGSEIGINIESEQAYKNIDDIFSSDLINELSSITVGRGDLVQSMKMDRYGNSVNSDVIFVMTKKIFSKCRENGLECTLGGSMTIESKDFISDLISENLLDKFETRNVIVHCDALIHYDFEEIIESILDFELNYLKFRTDYYSMLAKQDEVRIKRMEKLS